MDIAINELKKTLKSPVIWLVMITFLAFNCFLIVEYTQSIDGKSATRQMHDAVLAYGVQLEHTSFSATNETEEFYENYVNTYQTLYDGLDMLSILQTKEKLSNYYPKGKYASFLEKNYEKLQRRVEEIQTTGENTYGFYPGMSYEVHSTLYSVIGKKLLLEMAVLMMLGILYLMDYERIQKTQDIVFATRLGKKVMKTKLVAGGCTGLLFSTVLLLGTYFFFFTTISFDGLWNVPVASAVLSEKRGILFYPFVTFWKITQAQYLILNIVTYLLVLFLVVGITAALYLALRNGYLTFLVECLLLLGCYSLAFISSTGAFCDIIKLLCNPAVLWITCGEWFMENDIILSFAGNEFWSLGCCMSLVTFLLFVTVKQYRKMDVK